ncbi:MAG: hypothetical protein AABX37_01325 [Nanoarchaeota archaeon]
MVYLRVKVPCFRCNRQFEKTEVRRIEAMNKEYKYECFTCFRRSLNVPFGAQEEARGKREFFCQRCKYRYSARSAICPYCNEMDMVVPGKVSIQDLL